MTRHVTFMTIDDAEHYTPQERAAIVAAYPAHEREARAAGIPVLGSGRIFPVAEELIVCEPFRLPRYWPRIGALDFGWDHPSAAVELTWDTEADVVYVSNGIWLMFDRAGDKGADGAGTGDFTGPAASVVDNIVTFAGTTGKAGKDSGVAVSSLAPRANPAFTGSPSAPTQSAGDNSTKLATTAYVDTTYAPKASPTFTGTPTGPTATVGTNTTQLATTGFVKAAIDVVLGGVSAAFDTLSEIVASMVRKDADNTMSAGVAYAVVDDGTKSSGTYTPTYAGGNARKVINSGAHTLAAPSASGAYDVWIDYTNGASAGAITESGFTKRTGDPFTTVNAAKFRCYISKSDAGAHLHVQAMS
jgi:Terminase large subunit, T4likevirus-type, N-terminal